MSATAKNISIKNGKWCCVPKCKTKINAVSKSLHPFPKQKALKEQWIIALNMQEADILNESVCSDHFVKEDYTTAPISKKPLLRHTAIPALDIPKSAKPLDSPPSSDKVIARSRSGRLLKRKYEENDEFMLPKSKKSCPQINEDNEIQNNSKKENLAVEPKLNIGNPKVANKDSNLSTKIVIDDGKVAVKKEVSSKNTEPIALTASCGTKIIILKESKKQDTNNTSSKENLTSAVNKSKIFLKEESNLQEADKKNCQSDKNTKVIKIRSNISRCAVPNCNNIGGHLFPKKNSIRKKWIEFIGIPGWEPVIDQSIICTKHFDHKDYFLNGEMNGHVIKKLNENAVPSKNLPQQSIDVKSFDKKHSLDNTNKAKDINDIKKSTEQKVIVNSGTLVKIENKKNEKNTVLKKQILQPEILKNVQESLKKQAFVSKNYIQVQERSQMNLSHSGFKSNAKNELEKSASNVLSDNSSKTNRAVMTQINRLQLLSILDLRFNPKAVYFYTGLKNYEQLIFIFNSFGPDAFDLEYFDGESPKNIAAIDQFLITLIILRQHKSHLEMSVLFNITLKDVKNIFITWIRFMRLEWNSISFETVRKTHIVTNKSVDEVVVVKRRTLNNERKPPPTVDDVEKLNLFFKILSGTKNYIETHLSDDINYVARVLYNLKPKKIDK